MITAGTTPPESPCLTNQFSCTGGCVPLRALCDGPSDCPNAEDEKSCSKLAKKYCKVLIFMSANFSELKSAKLNIYKI